MKKLLLFLSMIFCLNTTSVAQMDTIITDTIHYYFNKYYFKTATSLINFPYYKSAAATVTVVTHVGSTFENSDELTITGLQAYASRNAKAIPVVPIHLYLCTLNVQGMPVLPAIDSVKTAVTGTMMVPIGGPLHNGPKTITGDFAILFRNMSTVSGDTAHLLRTAALTPTNPNATPIVLNSEGKGVVRYNGQFFSATNYTAPGFGIGTDYEFCVAPCVTYTIRAGQIKPADINPDDSIVCTQDQKIYTSTTGRRVSHRMYNLVEFRRRWDNNPPFHQNAVPAVPLPGEESAITWHFIPEDAVNYPLPMNSTTGQIVFYTDSAHVSLVDGSDSTTCFPGNEYRVRLHGMNVFGGGIKYYYNDNFTLCTSFCGDDFVGLKPSQPFSKLKIYPNPAVNGKSMITGLDERTEITLYNVLGQAVISQSADKSTAELDMNGLAPGQYLLKLQGSKGIKVVKVLKQY